MFPLENFVDEFEKRAWWNLCVALGAVVVFATAWMVTRNPAASMAAFAILALSAAPFFSFRQPASDERDREIERRSMMAAMRLFWILLVMAAVSMGFALGWDTPVQVPVRVFSDVIWGGWIVILMAKSVASIRMYRAR
jgi:hypothetical protein